MDKVTNWTGEVIDSALYLQLQDLTTVLVQDDRFTFAYSHNALVDVVNRRVTGSSFWEMHEEEMKQAGYRSDLFLRGVGTLRDSDLPALQRYFQSTNESKLPKFAAQLVTCLEDLRLQNVLETRRPGMKRDFAVRTKAMKHFFLAQLRANREQGLALDELFCLIYLQLHADEPDPDFSEASEKQLEQLIHIQPLLFDSYSMHHTKEIVSIAARILWTLNETYTDMQREYIAFPIKELSDRTDRTLFDELTRTDPLANQDEEEVDEEDNEYFDQSFSTWHRENENSDRKQNLLQFELDVGTKTDLEGGNTRETNEGDEATASMQGSSGESDKQDYSEKEALPKQSSEEATLSESTIYGRENKYAVAKIKEAISPSAEEVERYQEYVEQTDPYRRKLANTIEKTLEHKRNAPHRNLLFGRLSKNLLPLVLGKSARVFYKKNCRVK